jgi:hypothetical protein
MHHYEQLEHNRSRRLTGAQNSQVIVPGRLSTMNQVERLRYIQDAQSRQDFVSLADLSPE